MAEQPTSGEPSSDQIRHTVGSGRRGIARHGNLKSPGGGTKAILKWASIGLVTVLVSVVGLAALVVAQLAGSVTFATAGGAATASENIPRVDAFEGSFNFLLMGTDGRDDPDSDVQGERSDVIVLLHVNADHTSATAISFPRDLMVPIPACDKEDGSGTYSAMSKQQINSAISYGGPACVAKTIESLTGLSVPFYATVNFQGVIEMTNAIGGVTVCSTGDVYDPDSGLTLTTGDNVLEGANALAFLRMRHGYAAGSDLARISGQQVYMSALVRKITSEGTLTDPFKLYGLATAAAENLVLSPNLASLDVLVSLAAAAASISPEHMVFVQAPTVRDPDSANRVVLESYAAEQLFAMIASDTEVALAEEGGSDAVIVQSESAEAPATAEATTEATDSAASSSSVSAAEPSASSSAAVLPESITGQSAGTLSCVNPG